MRLTGHDVVLRRPAMTDLDARTRWFADPEVTRYLPLAGKSSLPRESVEAYLASVITNDRPLLDFSIDHADGRPIGSCSLRDFDRANRAELSLIIGERWAWGKGYGREAMRLLVDYGFQDLGLNTIWLVVRADNDRAVRLWERLGFRRDGVMRAAAYVDGVYYDKLIMSLMRAEWGDHLRSEDDGPGPRK